MSIFTIYLNGNRTAEISGTEYAYEVWAKVKELAELLNEAATLVDNETAEVIEEYDPEEGFEDYEPDDLESGFDPYEGCYTFDC